MATSPSCELDFFSMEKDSKPPKRSFRELQGVISKMNPDVVKCVINNATFAPNKSSHPLPPTPKLSLGGRSEKNENTAPMTIFYDGMVLVFDLSPQQATEIVNAAKEMRSKAVERNTDAQMNLLESLNGADLPISRRNSLQRFLQKRKERLTTLSPYYFPMES
uniref:Protein TIFY n=1 Tax=Pogostemon cablin TaxID=28511 RepID=A0A7G7XNT5_POGCB|nr:jasmonate ZIM-domain protein [Pogostemon cablin]